MNDVNPPSKMPSGSQASGNRLVRVLGFALLLAAIGLCLFLLSRETQIGGGRLMHYGLRAGIVVLSLAAWFWSQSLIGSRELKDGLITDGVHELSAPLHRYLTAHPKAAKAVLIVSSLCIDIFGIFVICAGIFGSTLRPFVALLILFAFRQFCQALCALPAPRGMIWRHPGVPSLLVTYGVGNDFFFSGHTAVAMLSAIEIARVAPLWLGITAGVIAFLEAVTVVVLRAHYTMDIIAAICATWCAFTLANWLCSFL